MFLVFFLRNNELKIVQSYRIHTDSKRQPDSRKRESRVSSTLDVTLYTFTSLSLLTMTTTASRFFFLFFFICAPLRLYIYINMRVLSVLFISLSLSLSLLRYSESLIGKRDSAANGRLIK